MKLVGMLPSCCLLLAAVAASAGGADPLPRLRVSPDGRRLVTEAGKPFVWLGDTAWYLFANLNREEAARYLRDRAAKRFTVIQAQLVVAETELPNAYGVSPFAGNDLSRPNADYFHHAAGVIDDAAGLGLYVLLAPLWARAHIERKAPLVTTAEAAEAYGRYAGRLLRDRTNVIWCLGGDIRPARHEIYDAMARGIAAGLGRKPLMTYHPPGGTNRPPATSTGEFYHDKPWLDFNMIQSGHRRGNENFRRIAEDYERVPVKPTLDSEPCYERHPIRHNFVNGAFEAADLRQRAYWSILAGAFGFTYGANGIWQMSRAERPGAATHLNYYWDAALDYEGARQMRFVHEILAEYPERVPDASVLGPASGAGLDHLQAARTPRGDAWLIYTANGRTFELKLPAAKGRAWWFNPRDGKKTAAAWRRVFNPPGEPGFGNDWLLILEPRR